MRLLLFQVSSVWNITDLSISEKTRVITVRRTTRMENSEKATLFAIYFFMISLPE